MVAEAIHELLLQFFITVIPIIIYGSRSHTTMISRDHKWWFDALLVSTMLICMTFPVRYIEGSIGDLREIPMIIGVLYGGPITAIATFVAFVAYRLILGGIGAYGAILINASVIIALLLLTGPYRRANKHQRLVMAVAASIGAGGLLMLYRNIVFHYGSPEFLVIMGLLGLLQTSSVAFIVYLLESFDSALVTRQLLIKAQRDKDRFLTEMGASVAHELRSPMTVIKGFLQLFDKQELSDSQKDYIQYCLKEVGTCESTISNYLTIARPNEGSHEILNVQQELGLVVDSILPLARQNHIKIVTDMGQATYIYGVHGKLQTVLFNLCLNAIEAMPKGGVLNLKLRSAANELIISISDTGCGMTATQVAALGTPSYGTTQKGTGVGTMMSYRIIEALGGSIECQSVVDQGTSFTIRIPTIGHSPVQVFQPATP